MICPHCRHLMSVDPDIESPEWVPKAARLVVLFLIAIVVFYLIAHAS